MEIHHIQTGLKVTNKILDKWQLNTSEKYALLSFDIANANAEELTEDNLICISLILNIHEALAILFKNPDNHFGFMKMANKNFPFNGRRPIDLAMENDGLSQVYSALKEVGKSLYF